MDTSVINIRTDRKTKLEAQKVLEDLGLSVSAVLNAYLKQLVRTKTVHLSLLQGERPSLALRKTLRDAEKELKKGEYASFEKLADSLDYLDTL